MCDSSPTVLRRTVGAERRAEGTWREIHVGRIPNKLFVHYYLSYFLLYSAHVRMRSSMHYFALLHTLLNDAEPTAVAVKWDAMK
jgi:hypothetical protein